MEWSKHSKITTGKKADYLQFHIGREHEKLERLLTQELLKDGKKTKEGPAPGGGLRELKDKLKDRGEFGKGKGKGWRE